MTRVEKAEVIGKLYSRNNTQESIAKLLKMSVSDVGAVTRWMGFKHTKYVTPENLNDNQLIKPIRFEEDISFLDKYPDENFIDYLKEV